jgi:hypothetical protein
MVIVDQLQGLKRDDKRRRLMVVALIGTISMQDRNYFNVAEAFKNITVKKGSNKRSRKWGWFPCSIDFHRLMPSFTADGGSDF